MTNFLMGKCYREYIEGNQEDTPMLSEENPTPQQVNAFKDWNQEARKVMYWSSISMENTMIGHKQDANSPKEEWKNLVAIDLTNKKARNLHLKIELNIVKKHNFSINDYVLKIKDISESLASISVMLEDDDKAKACFHGLDPSYKQFKTSFYTKEKILSFIDLMSLLIVEEKNISE
ncbi:hypothetical protein L7F22_034874 [Adiantum nelumboides]|nr:hypothetical protein [Adiantum nelumboides]